MNTTETKQTFSNKRRFIDHNDKFQILLTEKYHIRYEYKFYS